ncbi:MAG: hypothetical protein J6U54_25735 [Clostridiales bacterium]|nr:hypothetical protein [Clostridiales bacterium]
MKDDRYIYLVEGDCEKKLIEVLKEQKNLIVSGKVYRINVIQEHLSETFLRTFLDNTIVILVFDTDTDNNTILFKNIQTLSRHQKIKDIWYVIQVENLEDEIVKSTDLSDAKALIGCTGSKEYKHYFIKEKNLYDKLLKHHFDMSKIWITDPKGAFKRLKNEGFRIKRSE